MKRTLIFAVSVIVTVLLAVPVSAQLMKRTVPAVQPAQPVVRAPAPKITPQTQITVEQATQLMRLETLGKSLVNQTKWVDNVVRFNPNLFNHYGCRVPYLSHMGTGQMEESVDCHSALTAANKKGVLCEFLLDDAKKLYETPSACASNYTPSPYATERLYGCLLKDGATAQTAACLYRVFKETSDGKFLGKVVNTDELMEICADGCDSSEIIKAALDSSSGLLKDGYMCGKILPIEPVCVLGESFGNNPYGQVKPLHEHYCCTINETEQQ